MSGIVPLLAVFFEESVVLCTIPAGFACLKEMIGLNIETLKPIKLTKFTEDVSPISPDVDSSY